MTRRVAARVVLASALVVPVVAGAAPGLPPQTPQTSAGQSELSFTVDTINPQHARLVITSQGAVTLSLDANAVTMTYTADGLVVDMKGPGTLTTSGHTLPVTDLGTARLTLKDGRPVKFQVTDGGTTFACPPLRAMPGCAAGS